MKIIFTILLVVNFWVCNAQDPQLSDTTWNLHELIVDGITIIPTNPIHLGELIFEDNETILIVNNQGCEFGYIAEIENFNDTSAFVLTYFEPSPFGTGCGSNPENEQLAFLETHATFYIDFPASPPKNTFTYTITEDSGMETLTINNGNGDTAVYRDIPLSVDTNSIYNIKLLYKSGTQEIIFSGVQNTSTLSIHNLLGQQIIRTTINKNEPLLVNTLKQGIYLVSLSQPNGKEQVFKFVKN